MELGSVTLKINNQHTPWKMIHQTSYGYNMDLLQGPETTWAISLCLYG
jgi:hypothetical protein